MIQTILFVFVTTYLQHMLNKYIHSLFWGLGSVSSSGQPRFLRGLGSRTAQDYYTIDYCTLDQYTIDIFENIASQGFVSEIHPDN